MNVDIVVSITYKMGNPPEIVVRTNTTREGAEEVMASFIYSQMGKGKDSRVVNKQDEYHISLEMSLEDDTIYLASDTGNDGLTLGIVVDVLKKFDSIAISE